MVHFCYTSGYPYTETRIRTRRSEANKIGRDKPCANESRTAREGLRGVSVSTLSAVSGEREGYRSAP